MYYLFAVILMTSVLFMAAGCRKQKLQEPNFPLSSAIVSKSSTFLSREKIQSQLQKIALSPRPETKKISAMCYEIAAPPSVAEYVCPKCGEKTLYVREMANSSDKGNIADQDTISALKWELDGCRRQIQKISKLSVELDESQFCKKCSPDVKNPQLVLVVHYPEEQKIHRYMGVTTSDFELLIHFLNGEKKYKLMMDDETAIKDHLQQLKKLLGV